MPVRFVLSPFTGILELAEVAPTEGGGGTNTLTEVTPGIELTQRFVLSNDEAVEPGIAISQGPITAQITQVPGVELVPSASGAPQVTQQPGVQLEQRFAQSGTQQTPAFEIVQAKYDLTKRVGSNAATQTAVSGRTDWQNVTNAQGTEDGVMATFAGNATGARGGRVRLEYANVTGKTDFTISLVQLLFYGRVFGTIANNAQVFPTYRIGAAADVLLETITGDLDFRVTPRTYDITAAMGGSWATIDSTGASMGALADLGELWQAELDAVILRVIASVTDSL